MKTKICLSCFVSFLTGAVALNQVAAAQKTWTVVAQTAEPRIKYESRLSGRPGQPAEKETVTFLGVETAPVSATLSSQLGLAKDSGLVVIAVVPDSPAASVLKQHDILVKLDDQLLVEPRQFSVLVRNHKEGDEVAFTYLRAGKQAAVKIKLGKHEVPKLALMSEAMGAGHFDGSFNLNDLRGSREETDRVLGLLQGGTREVRTLSGSTVPQRMIRGAPREGPGLRAINVNPGNSSLAFTDEHGSLELTIKEGNKTLVAKNPRGEQLFSGPVNTPEERNALPGDIRDRLDRLEGMQDFTFKTEEGFVPSTKTIRAFPQGIAFPEPATDNVPRPAVSRAL